MRIMYIAPRFHTNQAPIIKGLKEHGHEICFLSHYQGMIEDYSVIKPVVIGYSRVFLFWERFYIKVLHKNDPKAVDMRLKSGFPPVGKVRKLVKGFLPDVVIIRERSIYSIVTYMSCRNLGIPFILYNQSPLWEKKIKNDIPHRIVKSMLPKVRMTPVMGDPRTGEREERAFFIPFVIEPGQTVEQKQWFRNDKINILCVAKYEKRKNIDMLIDVFSELQEQYELTLTVTGECTSDFHKEYFNVQQSHIEKLRQEQNITLLKNLSREDTDVMYSRSDLFILPSTDEPASVSQMEAMAYSVPVICSDQNGTACYVHDNENGLLFRDRDRDDLKKKMICIISDRSRLISMGKNGYDFIKKDCSYDLYYNGINKCIDECNRYREVHNK